MSGQLVEGPLLLDCAPELVCVPVDVDVVLPGAAKAIPTEDNAATNEIASIEYASRLRLFPPRPSLKLVLFHLLRLPERGLV